MESVLFCTLGCETWRPSLAGEIYRGNAADMNFKSGYDCQPGFDNVTEHLIIIWKSVTTFPIPHVSPATFAT